MDRTISAATLFLLAMTLAASAQTGGPIGSTSIGPSFSGDVMSGNATVSGLDVRVGAGSASRLTPMEDPSAARDGCINYPGQAHNSADCSRILAWDPSWVLPNKPLNEMTGAEENMVRSYNILHSNIPAPKTAH